MSIAKYQNKLTEMADAIREKDGTTDPIVANNYPTRIADIPAGAGSMDHSVLENRDLADAHPMSAITGLEDSINEINTDISALETRADGVDSTITGVNASITSLQADDTKTKTDIVDINNNLKKLQTNINEVENVAYSADSSAKAAEASVTSVKADITTINDTITGINTNITALDDRVDGVEESITNLTNDVNDNLGAKVDAAVAESLGEYDTRLTATETALDAKQDTLVPDDTLTITDSKNIKVTTPIKTVTQAEYDKLTDKTGVYVITNNNTGTLDKESVTIEEYTEGYWTVRKWSNGYVEMFFQREITTAGWADYGGLYRATSYIGGAAFPVPLITKYSEVGNFVAQSNFIMTISRNGSYGTTSYLKNCGMYEIICNEKVSISITGYIVVTGRWK